MAADSSIQPSCNIRLCNQEGSRIYDANLVKWDHSLCPLHFLISSVITLSQSLDELDDDDGGEKDRREEEELVQANTFQNESMTADPAAGYLLVRSDMM